jgi:hypothetical protein
VLAHHQTHAMAAQQPDDKFPELDVDYVTVPGQLYCVLSIVGPTGTNQRNDKFGLKIRGCFASVDEARSHVKRLQQTDPVMDIFVADMYKWLLIPPDVNAIDDQEFQESFLNDLIKGYRENQVAAKQHFNERKENVKRDGLDQHLLEHERISSDNQAAIFEEKDPLQARKEAEAAAAGEPAV